MNIYALQLNDYTTAYVMASDHSKAIRWCVARGKLVESWDITDGAPAAVTIWEARM